MERQRAGIKRKPHTTQKADCTGHTHRSRLLLFSHIPSSAGIFCCICLVGFSRFALGSFCFLQRIQHRLHGLNAAPQLLAFLRLVLRLCLSFQSLQMSAQAKQIRLPERHGLRLAACQSLLHVPERSGIVRGISGNAGTLEGCGNGVDRRSRRGSPRFRLPHGLQKFCFCQCGFLRNTRQPDKQWKSYAVSPFFRVWSKNPSRNETRQPDKHEFCLSGFPSVCLVVGFSPDKVKTTQFRCFLVCLSGCLVCLVVSTSGNKGRCRAGVYFCSAGRSQFDCPTASPPETVPVPLRFAARGYS